MKTGRPEGPDYDLSPQHTGAARCSAFNYMTAVGPELFSSEDPELLAQLKPPVNWRNIPRSKLGPMWAEMEADTLAKARLFHLSPVASDLAIQYGAEMRAGNSRHFGPPPVPFGFLVAPGGLSYAEDGVPIIGVHWRKNGERQYRICWWASTLDDPNLLAFMGHLQFMAGMDIVLATLGPEQQGVVPGGVDLMTSNDGDLTPKQAVVFALLFTVAGAWALFRDGLAEVDKIPISDQERQFNAENGILDSPVRYGYVAGTDDPAQLWDYGKGPVP